MDGTAVWNLKLNVDATQAKNELNSLAEAVNMSFQKMNVRMGHGEKAMYGFGDSMSEAAKEGKRAIENIGVTAEKPQTVWENVTQTIDNATKGVNKFRRGVMMAFMSIMWFSFTIKKMLEGFARSAVDTFMKVTDANNELNRGFTYLTATWEYFKFSFINAALGPILMILLPIIIDIVDKFVEWMDTNPDMAKMLGYLVLIGIVLATIGFWIGQVGLFFIGIVSLIVAISGAGTAALIVLGLIGIVLLGIAIAAVLFFALWASNLGGFRESCKKIIGYLGGIADAVMTYFPQIATELIGFIKAIYEGNFEEASKHLDKYIQLFTLMNGEINIALKQIGLEIQLWGAKAFLQIMIAIGNIATFISDKIKQAMVDIFVEGINKIIDLANALPGMIKIPKLTAPKVVSEESDIVKLMKSGLTSLESPELRKILEDVYGITALRKELDGLKEENEKLSSGAESAKETTEEQTKATEKQTDITKIFGDLINQHTDLLKANGIPTTEEQTKATTKQTEQTTVYAQLQKAYTDYMNGTGIPAIQSQINVSQLLSSTLDGVGLTFSQTAETAKAATKAIQDYNAMAADYDKRWGTGAFATYKATGQTVGNTGGYSYTDVTGKTVATAKNTFYDPNTKSNFTVNPEYATLYSDQMIFQEGMNHPAVTTGNIDILTGWGKTGYAVNDIVPVQTGGELQALQGGGIVSKAGLFNLHAGEAVVPAGDNYSYGGITISINNPVVRSEADIDDLAKKVGEKIKDAISRRVRLV